MVLVLVRCTRSQARTSHVRSLELVLHRCRQAQVQRVRALELVFQRFQQVLGATYSGRQHLRDVSEEHERFLSRIPLVRDVQSAWLLLLHCAQARGNFLLRAVRPEAVEEFATRHDRGLWWWPRFWGVNLEQCEVGMREAATLPLVLGGLGAPKRKFAQGTLLSGRAGLIASPWWGARHPEVAARLVVQLEGHPATPCLGAAAAAARA